MRRCDPGPCRTSLALLAISDTVEAEEYVGRASSRFWEIRMQQYVPHRLDLDHGIVGRSFKKQIQSSCEIYCSAST